LKHYPHIIYSDGIADLRKRLTERIRRYLENPIPSSRASFFPFDLSIQGFSLSEDKRTVVSVDKTTIHEEFFTSYRKPYDLILRNISQKTTSNNQYEVHIGFASDVLTGVDRFETFLRSDKYDIFTTICQRADLCS
jgi:hypothetical protein